MIHPDFSRIAEEILSGNNKITFLGAKLAQLLTLRRICKGICRIYTMKEKKEFDELPEDQRVILFCKRDELYVPLKEFVGPVVVEVEINMMM